MLSLGLRQLASPMLQLMEQVEAAYHAEVAEGRQLEADQLAEQLVQRGHAVTVRTALGGGGGCECLRNLRHVFLCVQMQVRVHVKVTLLASHTEYLEVMKYLSSWNTGAFQDQVALLYLCAHGISNCAVLGPLSF